MCPDSDGRPVPVRQTLRPADTGGEDAPDATAEEHGGAATEAAFSAGGEQWIARVAGAGAYGTGRLGGARLEAVQFFRAEAPEAAVREALVPAGSLLRLMPRELRSLLERAVPMHDSTGG